VGRAIAGNTDDVLVSGFKDSTAISLWSGPCPGQVAFSVMNQSNYSSVRLAYGDHDARHMHPNQHRKSAAHVQVEVFKQFSIQTYE
jgi:hypothetical protein